MSHGFQISPWPDEEGEQINSMSSLKSALSLSNYDSMGIIMNDLNPPSIQTPHDVINSLKEIKDIKTGPNTRCMYWFHVFSALIVFILIILFSVYHHIVYLSIQSFVTVIVSQNSFFAPILYIFICYLCIMLLIPQTLLTIFGGFVFSKMLGLRGMFVGILSTWIGVSLGSTQSFLNCRYIYQYNNCIFKTLQQFNDYGQISTVLKHTNGFKLCLILRSIPWTPFNVFNLSIAMTRIKFIHFVGAHCAMIIDVTVWCFIGGFFDSISRIIYNDNYNGSASVLFVVNTFGAMGSIIAMVYIGAHANNQYKLIIKETNKLFKNKITKETDTTKTHTNYYNTTHASVIEYSLNSNVSDLALL